MFYNELANTGWSWVEPYLQLSRMMMVVAPSLVLRQAFIRKNVVLFGSALLVFVFFFDNAVVQTVMGPYNPPTLLRTLGDLGLVGVFGWTLLVQLRLAVSARC